MRVRKILHGFKRSKIVLFTIKDFCWRIHAEKAPMLFAIKTMLLYFDFNIFTARKAKMHAFHRAKPASCQKANPQSVDWPESPLLALYSFTNDPISTRLPSGSAM